MGAIEEIKGKIESLGEAEQAELRAWFIERDHMLWDKQIERDLEAGKLDALIAEAEADRRAGLGRAL